MDTRLLDQMVEAQILQSGQARLVRQRQGAMGGALADHLLELGLLGLDELGEQLSRVAGIPLLTSLELDLADRAMRRFLSPSLAKRARLVPVCLIGRRLVLACQCPDDIEPLMEQIAWAHHLQPELRVTAPYLIECLIAWLYGGEPGSRSQALCERLHPRFFRGPTMDHALEAGGATREPLVMPSSPPSTWGLGELLDQLRNRDRASDWFSCLRQELARWSPPVELHKKRPVSNGPIRGLQEPVLVGGTARLWLVCEPEGRRLDRVRTTRIKGLAELLAPELGRVLGA